MKKLLLAVSLTAVLAGCAGYVPGRQAYWDAQVREMCEKDGGVYVIERIPISKEQYDDLKKFRPFFSVPPRVLAKNEDILFWDESVTVFREANPRVWRSERIVKRQSDEKVVARVISYSRVGGDIPSPAHSSHFGCPEDKEIFPKLEKLFLLIGGVK